jgi:hypothetical protein
LDGFEKLKRSRKKRKYNNRDSKNDVREVNKGAYFCPSMADFSKYP